MESKGYSKEGSISATNQFHRMSKPPLVISEKIEHQKWRLITGTILALSLLLLVQTVHGAAPVITIPPGGVTNSFGDVFFPSQTNIVHSNVVLSVTVSGTAPLTFQWQYGSGGPVIVNGVNPIGEASGATTSTLMISDIQKLAGGPPTPAIPFVLTVSNAEGSAKAFLPVFVLGYIEAQILAFHPGDPPILIPAGQYPENLIIDKDVTLIGALGPNFVRIVPDPEAFGPLITVKSNRTVTLENFTLSGGGNLAPGGDIHNDGTLNLINVVVEDGHSFQGGGIYNGGIANLLNVVVRNNGVSVNGGGILNDGFLTLSNSLVVSNTAFDAEGQSGSGGGIANNGTCILDHSTVSQNKAPSAGAGILSLSSPNLVINSSTISSNTGFFEGFASESTIAADVLNMTNSTVANNLASWAVTANGGVIAYSTIASNIALGLRVSFPATNSIDLLATIVAGNNSGGPDCSGNINSLGYNLIQNRGSANITGVTTGNIFGKNPLLGPLQDNGGSTFTMALLTGSPAIDAGSPTDFPPTDQRDAPRPQDGDGNGIAIADIGAYEKHGPPPVTLFVTSLNDSGPGTLRQALGIAAPGDVIKIVVEGTMVLTSVPLTVNQSVQILGPCDGNLVILPRETAIQDTNGANRAFNISSNVIVTIADLTISSGSGAFGAGDVSGAGIMNRGNLTLIRCGVTNCSAEFGLGGGIFSFGPLTLEQCTIVHNNSGAGGGGLVSLGRLIMDRSTVSENQTIDTLSAPGGGILLGSGTALITNSTISSNICIEGNGGGISAASYVRFESCTVVSNSASGTIFSPRNEINGEGGGIFSTAVIESRNTIFAGNSATNFPASEILGLSTFGPDIFGQMLSQGWNLIQNPSGVTISGVVTGNQLGVNPLLGPLQNNGGLTPTHALLPGSPAIDAGSPFTFPSTDQRGLPRPQDGNGDLVFVTDIGAYEKATVIPGTVPGNIVVTSLLDAGAGTLRQALFNAVAGNKITFAVQGTIVLTSGPLVVNKNVTIAGPGAQQLFIVPQPSVPGISGRAFVVPSSVTASIFDLTVANGVAASSFGADPSGGGLQNFGNLTMTRCVVTNCSAEFGFGGGIYSLGALTLRQCSISGNAAGPGGGGVLCDGKLIVDACTISGNSAVDSQNTSGGGILEGSGTALITNSTISGNIVSAGDGGGIFSSSYVRLESCTVVSNSSSGAVLNPNLTNGRGGGIAATVGFESRNTIFAGNRALTQTMTGPVSIGPDAFGTMLSQGWNLIQNPSGVSIAGVLTGNITGVDPKLAPLQNNGGPTLTHALLTGSPAIDGGSPFTFPNSDQRGLTRPADGNGDGVAIADIGAFELQSPCLDH